MGGVDSAGGTFWLRDTPANQVLKKLKRQAEPSTCDCYEPQTELYALKTPEPYMAIAFGECTISASTSNLCPTDFLCACQYNGTSICLPTAIRTTTDCGNPYLGPTTYPPTNFTWSLSSPLPDFAYPTEQCGGTLAAAATLSWSTIQTRCPASQSCVCQTASRFSRCIDTTDIPATGAPTDCLTCKYEFNYNLPPPSATARLGGQCGGKCWTGPTNCPTSATCFTETSPIPGGYAECALTNPSQRLKVRQEGHEVFDVNLPARVQAIATPIYF
ncbi:uncharacterized protein DFL_007746 [Arthrobotrys flagrans]|uniref:CBM1 domain-containing protein n=1 Tax=Arthrobotrys flagrans TaxID=97331 RepID=A0A436ZX99_ARTFL|nr:hypothetical protein DFL_007746 [Arthrobotrys flagrans]